MKESDTSARTLHDGAWAEAAEHASLVVFGGIELCQDSVVWIAELRFACWADAKARART